MTTALQLRNRLARLHRFPDVTGFDDDMSPVLLDLLNVAASEILDERTWQFMVRDDGVQKFTASSTGTTGMSLVNGSTGVAIAVTAGTGLDTTLTQHNAMSWILATADASYSQTPMRLMSCTEVGTVFTGVLESAWEGTTLATTGAYRYFAFEYVLPSTVRSILDVRHQERPLRLQEVSGTKDFYQAYPRPHDYLGDPDLVVVGGSGITTYDSGAASAGTRGTVLRVFPVPDSDGWLNYSYLYQQPLLTATTDEWTGVPERILGLIVDLAYARSMQVGVGGEPTTGLALERRVWGEVARKYASDRVDGLRPTPLRSLDAICPANQGIGRVPSEFEGY